jgi:putative ATPase
MGDGVSAADGEILTWSAQSKGREGWFKRLESGRSRLLLSDRDRIIEQCVIARHHRVLVAAANDGLLLWESLRRVPEGLAAAVVDSEEAKQALLRFSAAFDHSETLMMAVVPHSLLPSPEEAEEFFSCGVFDHILCREPWRRITNLQTAGLSVFDEFAGAAAKLLAPGADVSILQSPPRLGERISRILTHECGAPEALAEKLALAEEAFFNGSFNRSLPDENNAARWTWDAETLKKSFGGAGFTVTITELDQSEERLITPKDLSLWFDAEKSSWGAFIAKVLGKKDFSEIQGYFENRIKEGPVMWKWKSLALKAFKQDN